MLYCIPELGKGDLLYLGRILTSFVWRIILSFVGVLKFDIALVTRAFFFLDSVFDEECILNWAIFSFEK